MHGKIRQGFTLVELSIAIAFIGVLSIAIMLIINNTISTYRRGITLNEVNTVGMELVDDLRGTIQKSAAETAENICDNFYSDQAAVSEETMQGCKTNGAMDLINRKKEADVKIRGENKSNIPIYGAFCTGKYSYVWNSGYFFSDDYEVDANSAILRWTDSVGKTTTEANFKLIKVKDDARTVCRSQKDTMDGEFNAGVVDDAPVDLLTKILKKNSGNGVDNNLALYDLEVAMPAVNDKSHDAFYEISLILGTVQGGVDIKSKGNYCATPTDYENENFDYCSINKFNFSARANGGN